MRQASYDEGRCCAERREKSRRGESTYDHGRPVLLAARAISLRGAIVDDDLLGLVSWT